MPRGERLITWERVRRILQNVKNGRTTVQIAQRIANSTSQEISIPGCYNTMRYFEKLGRVSRRRVGKNTVWALWSLVLDNE